MNPNPILSFLEPNAQNVELSGGKGANLAIMSTEGFPVPPGFIVSTTIFYDFMTSNQINKVVHEHLNDITTIDPEQIKQAGKHIRGQIINAPIPPELSHAVQIALQSHPPQTHFAVRSSATAEDLPSASFAGQQDTYLNINGLNSIIENIRRCWASLYTDRAITYRLQNQFNHLTVKIAVVVQEMVFPDISGILFTADPITNNHNIITINAGFGLGEALVSGIIIPDLYRIDKRSGQLLSKEIAVKKSAILPLADGGTHTISLDPEDQEKETLSQLQIKELIQLGIQVEKYYQFPQDIEWASANGKIYLLQTRPITSLYPIPSPKPNDQNLHIYFSFGHAQMMTDPISPMGMSILRLLLPFGCPPYQSLYAPNLVMAGGRLFADITSILNTKPGKKIFPNVLQSAEPVAAQQVSSLIQSPEFLDRNKTNKVRIKPSFLFEWVIPMFGRLGSWIFFRRLQYLSKVVLDKNQVYLDKQQSLIKNASTKEETLLEIKKSASSVLHQGLVWMLPMVSSGIIAKMILEKLLTKFNLEQEIINLQRGLSGNITTEMDLLVGDLSDLVRTTPELPQALNHHLENKLNWESFHFESYPEFNLRWHEFITRFGMRGPGEIDIGNPRWAENPQSIIQTILANNNHQQSGTHRTHFSSLMSKNKLAQEKIISTLKSSLHGRLILPLVKRLMKLITYMMPIREHPKYLIIRYLSFVHTELLSIAEELQTQGLLNQKNDIWLLELEDLLSHYRSESINLKDLIKSRRQLLVHYKKLTPPRVITSDGEIPRATLYRQGLPKNALIGSPVSSGVVEGIAHVIMDPSQEQLKPGEILVAPFTDPGWTPLFINAAGVVLETGGLMTHGSVVAREYGLPAVVGITNATTAIRSGMKIRVNGDGGFVEILSETI